MLPPRSTSGLTWLELLVAIAVIFVLAGMSIHPSDERMVQRMKMTQLLSNMKQLHLAAQQMALDGTTTDDPKLSWPGDTGGSFSHWAHQLVPAYLSTNDFCKLMSAPDKIVRHGKIPEMSECAILVYAVKADSPKSTIFLSSANFTNTPTGGIPPSRTAIPFGDKGFVYFMKGDAGTIIDSKNNNRTNPIGAFAPLCH